MTARGDVPPRWERITLEELVPWDAPIVYGIIQAGPDVADGVPYVRPTEMRDDDSIAVDELLRASPAIARKYDRATLRPGDVVLAIVGTIGKVALVPPSLDGANLNQSAARIRPPSFMPPSFLKYMLKSPHLREQFNEHEFGLGVRRLNLSHVRALVVDVPPVNEQRRIVEKLEALITRSRRAKEALEAIGVCESRLVRYYTHGWPEDALGAHFVERVELAGDEWGKYPVVGLSNQGEITARREAVGRKTARKCRVVRSGDVVFNPIRFSIGSIARYRDQAPAIVSPEYCVIQTQPTLSAELLVRYLRTVEGRSRLENETTGSVRYRVYPKTLAAVRVPLAPVHLQLQAERLLERLLNLNHARQAVYGLLDVLDRSILAKAFRGELVPQDPSDEPASALLERIHASRGAGAPTRPRKRRDAATEAR